MLRRVLKMVFFVLFALLALSAIAISPVRCLFGIEAAIVVCDVVMQLVVMCITAGGLWAFLQFNEDAKRCSKL